MDKDIPRKVVSSQNKISKSARNLAKKEGNELSWWTMQHETKAIEYSKNLYRF
jgi:hypothetical protein